MSCQKKTKSKIQLKKSKTRKHRGGSYASDLVMEAANSSPVKNDFVADPRVRDGPNADYTTMGLGTGNQSGGSDAYDMTMANLVDNATTNKFSEGWKVTGDMNSLNTYKPSGGKRRSKSHKSKTHKSKNHKSKSHKSNNNNSNNHKSNNHKSKNHKSKNHNSHRKSKSANRNNNNNRNSNHVVKGGSSDYMASYYSLDSNAKRPNIAWDPPSRDSAGSGYPMGSLEGAKVGKTGAPLV
jgi:hypothetical protein